jgi:hypothetical protein
MTLPTLNSDGLPHFRRAKGKFIEVGIKNLDQGEIGLLGGCLCATCLVDGMKRARAGVKPFDFLRADAYHFDNLV